MFRPIALSETAGGSPFMAGYRFHDAAQQHKATCFRYTRVPHSRAVGYAACEIETHPKGGPPVGLPGFHRSRPQKADQYEHPIGQENNHEVKRKPDPVEADPV